MTEETVFDNRGMTVSLPCHPERSEVSEIPLDFTLSLLPEGAEAELYDTHNIACKN
jgi:hypothetical protein